MMQLLFFTLGTTLPLNWARHVSALKVPEGWLHVMAADMLVALCALTAVVAIRRGSLRIPTMAVIGAMLVSLFVGYASLGFEKHLVDQTSQMLVLVVAGLVLGRGALWSAFGVLLAIFLVGFAVDAATFERSPRNGAAPLHLLPSVVFAYFVVVLVLDRCITALRSSLAESEDRRACLEHEIAERERTQVQLVHAQKMEIAGRMASGVAHDFSNVLAVILGLTKERFRISDPGGDPREDARVLADTLQCVESSAMRGIELSKKLLRFGRNDHPSPVTFDASEAVEGLKPLFKQLFPASVTVQAIPSNEGAWITADLAQFELALLNVASNARDAMPRGGMFQASVVVHQDIVEINLRDNGNGMESVVQQQAFEPFFSTKAPGQGTGLGLSLTRSLVGAARGTITLASELGVGTTVAIRLPRAAPPVALTL